MFIVQLSQAKLECCSTSTVKDPNIVYCSINMFILKSSSISFSLLPPLLTRVCDIEQGRD